jgi:hypothetical protein
MSGKKKTQEIYDGWCDNPKPKPKDENLKARAMIEDVWFGWLWEDGMSLRGFDLGSEAMADVESRSDAKGWKIAEEEELEETGRKAKSSKKQKKLILGCLGRKRRVRGAIVKSWRSRKQKRRRNGVKGTRLLAKGEQQKRKRARRGRRKVKKTKKKQKPKKVLDDDVEVIWDQAGRSKVKTKTEPGSRQWKVAKSSQEAARVAGGHPSGNEK